MSDYLQPIPFLMRTVWLQVLRRKDIYLLGLVMILFGVAAVIARILGLETREMHQFVAGLGYTLGSWVCGLLVIIVASQQMPAELESRTIYPILAAPVRRSQVLWGKFFPTIIIGAGMFLLCVAITYLTVERFPLQSRIVLFQAIVIKVISFGALAMMLIGLSLYCPTSVTLISGLVLYFMGGVFVKVLSGKNPHLLLNLVPDFRLMHHFERYVSGGPPLGIFEFFCAAGYGIVWFVMTAAMAIYGFNRKPL